MFIKKHLTLVFISFLLTMFPTKAQNTEQLDTFLDKNLIQSLNLFNNPEKPTDCLFCNINRTNTHFGALALEQILSNPPKDVNILEQNQAIIKALVQNTNLLTKLDSSLKELKKAEDDFLVFCEPYKKFFPHQNIPTEKLFIQFLNKQTESLKKQNILQICKDMWNNKRAAICSGLDFVSDCSAKLFLIYLFPISSYTFLINSFLQFLPTTQILQSNPQSSQILGQIKTMSLLLLAQFFFPTLGTDFYSSASTLFEVSALLKAINATKTQLIDIPVKQNDLCEKNLEFKKMLTNLIEKIQKIYELLKDQQIFTTIITDLNLKKETLTIIDHLKLIGKLDMFTSLAKLCTQEKYCLVDYNTESTKIDLNFIGIKAQINSEQPINLIINQENKRVKNIKTVAYSIILAHLGIANAEKAYITPLTKIYGTANHLTLIRDEAQALIVSEIK